MIEPKIDIGTIVHHPKRPDWGPGKALAIGGGGNVTVYFRDLEEKKAGDAVKTISTSVVPLEISTEQTDFILDNLPVYDGGAFKGMRKPRLSLDQAVQTFVDKMPGAFEDPTYIEQERSPMMDIHQMWVDGLGDGQGEALLKAGKIAEIRRVLLEIDAKLSLLRPHERTALKHGLENEDHAEPYIRALLKVTEGDEPERGSYQPLIDAVEEMVERGQGTRTTNWSVLTQFPFIARPEHHMGFIPTALQKCAARLNFDLHYTAAPNWWTYDRLLELSKTLQGRLEPMGAKDFIDVHSFIEVIAAA